jgi:hypothetical protein
MLYTFTSLVVVSVAVSHMGWLITSSSLFKPLREAVTNPILSEGIHCSICTITQLSLLLAWTVPDVLDVFVVGYILKAMLLAKLACLVYDAGELLVPTGSANDLVPVVIADSASMVDTEPV